MSNFIPKRLIPRALLRFPASNFPSLFEDIENEIERYGWEQSGLTLSEDENNLYAEAQMPGLKAKDINITLDKGMIRINGERIEKEEDKKKRFHRKASYSFSYCFALPAEIDEDKIDANYQEGVMKLTIPKIQKTKAKKIEVKGK